MPAGLNDFIEQLSANPFLYSLAALGALLVLAWLGNWIVKRILLRAIFRALRATPVRQLEENGNLKFIARLANVVPALIISEGILFVGPGLPEGPDHRGQQRGAGFYRTHHCTGYQPCYNPAEYPVRAPARCPA